MNFWKPGEEYPDQNEEEDSLSDDKISFSKNEKEPEKKKVLLSENLKTMPVYHNNLYLCFQFMVRSNAEKERKKEEVIALKELQAQLWSYRKVKAPEGSEVQYFNYYSLIHSSTHPCSGSMINTIEEEECKRFSFRGFNNNVEV